MVYHSNYLNFCERARSEAFFSKGLSPVLQNGHFVAKRVEAEYIASARLGDELFIKSSIVEFKAASFTLLQEIYKEGKKIFELHIVLVYTTFDAKPQRITKDIKNLVISLFS